jgi:hypothetical protein
MPKSKQYYHPDKDWFVKHDLTPPASISHGNEDEILKNIQSMKVKSWHLQGNKLIGEADAGRVMQTIPTDYICKGTDKNGLPILEKVVLSN